MLLGFAVTPYRCHSCSRRQLKYNTVEVGSDRPARKISTNELSGSAVSWLLRFREPALNVGLVLCSLELALQVAAVALWLAYRPVVEEQANGARAVFCIGDSYTFGQGFGQDSYPAALEKSLKRDDNAWRVVNAGLPGQNSRDVLLALRNEFANSRPALVYIMAGFDDSWSRPEMFKSPAAIRRNRGLTWRWRTGRFVALLVPVGKMLGSGGLRWISRLWRFVRYHGIDPVAASLVGTWSFQDQTVQIQADHQLQIGDRKYEWENHGNQIRVVASKWSGNLDLRYEWAQREGGLLLKGGQFPGGVLLKKSGVNPALMPASFIAEEPRFDSPTGVTLATHLRQMVDLARSAGSDVVLMSYPFHGRGDLNTIIRRVASDTGAGWIDLDTIFSERLSGTPTGNPYVQDRNLNRQGYALIANLLAADVRRRTNAVVADKSDQHTPRTRPSR